MIVSDGDISNNAAYELVLENIENAEGVFSVYPDRSTEKLTMCKNQRPDRLYTMMFSLLWS